MLIQLTRKCSEVCPHCMISASPSCPTMTKTVLEQTIKVINKLKPFIIILSGGEITEIPDFDKVIKNIIDSITYKNFTVFVLSNGTWINDVDKCVRMRNVSKLNEVSAIQISTHRKLYPSYNLVSSNASKFTKISPKIVYDEDWLDQKNGLMYFGRAKEIMTEDDIKCKPSCGTMLSVVKQYDKIKRSKPYLQGIIQYLEAMHKFCSPMISVEGNVHVGEAQTCMSVGNVSEVDDFDFNTLNKTWFDRMNKLKFCNNCKAVKNVPLEIRLALDL